jgi:hypothetical protein
MTPRLLVGIDTEGDNQWSAEAREHQTFENIYALPALHSLFEMHGVRPTYVVTWPVASDERSQEVLRFLLLRGDCEIGAHHHAWETPPCTPEDVRRHPYAASLPSTQFDAQLAELTTAITRAVGDRPVSYRSGRFGFAASHVSALSSPHRSAPSCVRSSSFDGAAAAATRRQRRSVAEGIGCTSVGVSSSATVAARRESVIR